MVETYKQLKKFITKDFKKYSNEDLAELYKKTNDEQIIAELYCRNINYWYRLNKKISIISDEEKASIILEKLYSCLLDYNKEKNTSFLAYVYVAINNAFGGIKTKNKFKHRYKEAGMLDLDGEVEGTDGLRLIDMIEDKSDALQVTTLKIAINGDKSLTKYEKRFCQIVLDNPGIELREIGIIMKVGYQRVWCIQKCLKEKIKMSLFF